MVSAVTSYGRSIERWSPTLFLLGGSLLVGHAALLGIQAFSNLTTPPDVFGPTGHLVALVGLFGLYPVLLDRTPRVARVAGAVASVALVSWAVMTVARFFAVTGIVSSLSNVLPGAFVVLVFASTILTYVLFGVATLRVNDSSVVSLLVLAPGVLVLVGLVGSALASVTALAGFVIGGGLALSVLVLGYTLRTRHRPSARRVPADDAATG